METNPFQPPSELADQGAPRAASSEAHGKKMYVPNHVAVAAFIGSPIAGAWLLGANYAALDRHAARTKALVWGFVATVLVFVLAVVAPERMPNSLIPLAYTFALRELARHLQGKDIERLLAAGGTKQSGWRVVLIGVAWCVLVVGTGATLLVVLGDH